MVGKFVTLSRGVVAAPCIVCSGSGPWLVVLPILTLPGPVFDHVHKHCSTANHLGNRLAQFPSVAISYA